MAVSDNIDTNSTVQVKWAGLEESDMTRELVPGTNKDTPAYLVIKLRKLKLTRATRIELQGQYGLTILSDHSVVFYSHVIKLRALWTQVHVS